MINKKIIQALGIITNKLKQKKIKWVVVGSLSLALQGVRIKPKDIDILTTKNGAFKMNKLFRKYQIKPVKFRHSDHFQSFFGEFKINGVKIEIMGNLKERLKGKWVSLSHRLKTHKIIEIGKMKVPVSNLKDQLKFYSKSSRRKDKIKAQKIKEVLKNANKNIWK